MNTRLALPMIAAALIFTGCEAVVTDHRPVRDYRHGHRSSYYHGRSGYYDGGVVYRSSPAYRSRYHERPRTTNYYGYGRARSPYYSTANRAPVVSIRRTEIRSGNNDNGNRQHYSSDKKYRGKKGKKDRD